MDNMSTKWKEKLVRHKKLIANACKDERQDLFRPIKETADELALVHSNYQCAMCKTQDRLQYHHLISRKCKQLMPFWQYVSQRNYWANIIILCTQCHAQIENRKHTREEKHIPQEHINKIKKKYV